ncbi:MAG: hypothetical protein EXR30_03530 [Betaproteobacteria bacterium]|nr:hypothetical protein [Betaproteobacteria bacterium]MSQ88440.1 hypothetical protein [Betaproteobacteria bacterium]
MLAPVLDAEQVADQIANWADLGAEGQLMRTPQEIAAMALMGVGGLIAVIGGLMFLVIAINSMRRGYRIA